MNLASALKLKQLHLMKLVGARYCDDYAINIQTINHHDEQCNLCNRYKSSQVSNGINKNSRITFVTILPTIDENGNFIQNKSSLMLENIITKVFLLQKEHCSILSMLKCDYTTPPKEDEIEVCKNLLANQISQNNSKVVVIFGIQIAQHIISEQINPQDKGREIWRDEKCFIITNSLNELNKTPSLKKETMGHLNIAKGYL